MGIRKRLKSPRSLKRQESPQTGFTLVELMIVVAIIGILAVLAIYGVRRYISNAKTAEARNNVGKIQKDALAAYEGEKLDTSSTLATGSSAKLVRAMCQSATWVPSAIPPPGQKYQSSKENWETGDVATGWKCLRFEINTPQYYSYNYIATGTSTGEFTAQALGDLNGDGTIFSTFSAYGKVQEGRLNASPSIEEINPEE
jgi:type IV pilus assembly protein PilA